MGESLRGGSTKRGNLKLKNVFVGVGGREG